MKLLPEIATFTERFAAGETQVVWTRLVADLDTPVSLMLKLTEARKDSFMLESVTGGEVRGRYSFMGMKPDLIWECHGTRARLNRSARFDADGWQDEPTAPLDSLRALIAESRITLPPELPAHGRRALRLSRLRHDPAGRASAGRQLPTRSACPTRSCCAPRSCWWSTGSRAR